MKFEPTNITDVTVKGGSKVRMGIANKVPEFNAEGGGLQIEKLSGDVEYGTTKKLTKGQKL